MKVRFAIEAEMLMSELGNISSIERSGEKIESFLVRLAGCSDKINGPSVAREPRPRVVSTLRQNRVRVLPSQVGQHDGVVLLVLAVCEHDLGAVRRDRRFTSISLRRSS